MLGLEINSIQIVYFKYMYANFCEIQTQINWGCLLSIAWQCIHPKGQAAKSKQQELLE